VSIDLSLFYCVSVHRKVSAFHNIETDEIFNKVKSNSKLTRITKFTSVQFFHKRMVDFPDRIYITMRTWANMSYMFNYFIGFIHPDYCENIFFSMQIDVSIKYHLAHNCFKFERNLI